MSQTRYVTKGNAYVTCGLLTQATIISPLLLPLFETLELNLLSLHVHSHYSKKVSHRRRWGRSPPCEARTGSRRFTTSRGSYYWQC